MEYYLLKKIQNYLQVNNLDAMIIPSTDPHMSEYVAESFQFRKVVSGFTGSAGTLVVGKKESALWTDSRYYLQAEIELQDSGILLMRDGEEQTPSVAEWIFSQKTETKELLVGYDFSFISVDWEKKFVAEITHLGGICNRFNVDYDEFWIDRPLMPSEEIWIYEEKFAGESVGQKIERLRKLMIEKSKRTDSYTIVSKLDEIAWLLNLRGSDVAYTPVFYAYLLVSQKQVVLYVDEQKLSPKVKAYLEENNIEIKQYFKNCVLQEIEKEDLYLCYDSKVLSVAIFSLIKKVGYEGLSLVGEMKAIKNETEIRNLRLAMKKDAKAVMAFEKWLFEALQNKADLTEISVAEKLLFFRQQQDGFLSESFAPIVAYAEHGAIVHYSATPKTNKKIESRGFLLIDSGGHYLEGTTDITRTYCLGDLTEEMSQNYEAVRKGNEALSKIVFPKGTCGFHLDVLARQFLWQLGLNYGHGTGHGIGQCLCVHEGPQNISQRVIEVPLQAGMIVSNEPGYYKSGEYGIRIENQLLVKPSSVSEDFLCFEVLTQVPIQKLG